MTNKENFLKLVSTDDSNTLDWLNERNANKKLRRTAQKISILILRRLKELKWSQKDLADKMEVSPQMVNKWVKGKDNNFSLDLLFRIGNYLGIELIEVPFNRSKVEVVSNPIEQSQVYKRGGERVICKNIPLNNCAVNEADY
ncbi:Helix-turn-helix [Arachidicoccus rhizosphaerae]|uniref:Helix-turn-helix n=1 Tax=Arachidicoccus rhizosphaerae TaxID=551991 RepID=A0A1H3XMI5_9BACT|nr:helix-turn-helix transcriptional regulator [Arachidicoccus rhizosphaerae]SEA00647.1 Helix-turn-helix [Arachidicoccus rhizosphaerae]